MRLYTYCLRWDDGAAPNPYWGICTLAICKPAIRRTAKVGDWVAGLGSTNSLIGDISSCVVYAMQITDIRSLWGYDILCNNKYPEKIPDWQSNDLERRVGDCIYDYGQGAPPTMRAGVHNEKNRTRDLSGNNALISNQFYYFGDKPIELPHELTGIIHPSQGHKVNSNQPYVEAFREWISNSHFSANVLHGEPQLKSAFEIDPEIALKCAETDLSDTDDEIC